MKKKKTKVIREPDAREIFYRYTIIALPHFNYDVKVVITSDISLYIQSKFPNIENPGSGNGFHIYSQDDCRSHIVLTDNPSIKTIAHEVFHVVWRLMEHVGAKHENEVMAYHQGYLTERISKWVLAQGEDWEKK